MLNKQWLLTNASRCCGTSYALESQVNPPLHCLRTHQEAPQSHPQPAVQDYDFGVASCSSDPCFSAFVLNPGPLTTQAFPGRYRDDSRPLPLPLLASMKPQVTLTHPGDWSQQEGLKESFHSTFSVLTVVLKS